MCQAYEAERAGIVWSEERASIEGWKANARGKALVENPYKYGIFQPQAWEHGWQCRRQGLVLWCIEREWRKQEGQRTGESCYSTPTVEQADRFVGLAV